MSRFGSSPDEEPVGLNDIDLIARNPAIGLSNREFGSTIVVPPNHAVVVFAGGALDVLPAGRHRLTRSSIPEFAATLGDASSDDESFAAAMVLVNRRPLTGSGWGTRHPTVFRDPKLGALLIRAHGRFSLRVTDPAKFVDTLHRQHGLHASTGARSFLCDIIVARLQSILRDVVPSIAELAERSIKVKNQLHERLADDFDRYGLELSDIDVDQLVLPDAARGALERPDRLSNRRSHERHAFHIKLASETDTASVLESVRVRRLPESPASATLLTSPRPVTDPGSADIGTPATSGPSCVQCSAALPSDARFCPDCGHQLEAAS